ncbi:MAG: PIN domain-containing protein [Armatimonadetes bacterium]|nr:PIN domain-containing protein [Armatimonadota bacterium]
MTVFVDTSAILAVLDADDTMHQPASRTWRDLVESGADLVTSNYVVIECDALVRRRLGMRAVRALHDSVLPVMDVEWIGEHAHHAALGAALLTGRDGPSLVDCVSFEVMRRSEIRTAFTFDRHFGTFGWTCIPAAGGPAS